MTTPGSGNAELREIAQVTSSAGPFAELGVTGLKRNVGYLDEEFLPQLKGHKAIQVYREMADNDAIIGALLFSIGNLLRNVTWNVTPAGKGTDDAKAAKLVETCMEDMSHSWDELIVEILSSLVYGWSLHEIVYKRRMGPWQKDPRHKSQFDDGLIGWRKMPIRAQETLQRWMFDDSGGVKAMVQLAPPDYQQRIIPIDRSLLFRNGASKNSPEGKSMLRNAYRSWFYKKRLEEFESIGVERDLAGMPKIGVPSSYLKAKPGSMEAKQVEALKKMARGLRRNEQEGIIFPLAYDEDTKQPLFTFELVGSGGSRQFQTDTLIQRYEQRMLMTVLADFILVGHEGVGTYNMHVDKTGIFKTSLNAIAGNIADVFNRHAIPRLFAANGWKPAQLPKIVPSDVDAPNLTELGGFLTQTAGLGFSWADADMEKFLRNAAGLPELADTDFNKHKVNARREEATRFAQTQTAYLAARSQLAQAMAAQQAMAAGQPAMDDIQEHASMSGTANDAQSSQANEQRTQEAHDSAQQTAGIGAVSSVAGMLGEGDKPAPKKK